MKKLAWSIFALMVIFNDEVFSAVALAVLVGMGLTVCIKKEAEYHDRRENSKVEDN